MAKLIPNRKLPRRESVSDIMLTPLLVLVLVFLFSAVGSVLAGS
ncbi:MAG TPA: hypothetical protein VH600_21330 [Burkholderiales bacterium]|jgi:hypothetical protein